MVHSSVVPSQNSTHSTEPTTCPASITAVNLTMSGAKTTEPESGLVSVIFTGDRPGVGRLAIQLAGSLPLCAADRRRRESPVPSASAGHGS